jgi:D-arabinose 1-dehydrogenase-like Zn-dependent alcohol dehydrogenase
LQEVSGGVDIIIDGAAGKSFLSLLEVASPGARIVNYGATLGDVPSFNLRRIFWKQLNLLGSTMGSPSDFKKMIDFVAQHKIRPVVDEVFNFDKAAEAMEKNE